MQHSAKAFSKSIQQSALSIQQNRAEIGASMQIFEEVDNGGSANAQADC